MVCTIFDNDSEYEKQLGWEKWRDPYGSDVEESDLPPAAHDTSDNDFDDDDFDDDHEDWKDEPQQTHKSKLPPKNTNGIGVLMTKMGMVPIVEHTNAGKIFNFWTAHTNFRLTPELLDIIDNTDGVETLDCYTPYRWRISIGKAFSSYSVKERVMKNLNAQPLKNDITE